MSDEKIEVEWIGTANGMLKVLDKLDKRMLSQEKQLQKIGDTSKKAANDAAGSFNKLEKELKENEAALRRMTIGTKQFDDQRRKVDQLKNSLRGARGELTNVGSGIGGALSGAVAKVAMLGAGMVSFQLVVTAVADELAKIRQLKIDAAATSRTLEQSLADVGQNIGGAAVPAARAMILENAPKLGVTQEGLADVLGVAISAGAKDLEEAMALASAALKLTVGDAAKARALVGSTLDVASLGGSKNFEGALGQLLQVQSQVRSTNLAEFGANIGPGLAAATSQGQHQQGVSTERAFEMASVISQVIKDQTGANTATTMRQMFTRMDSFMPERSKKLDDGGTATVSQQNIEAFRNAKTFDDRLEIMRKDEGIRLQFLETQRESIGKTAVREIVSGSDRALEFEAKAKQNITGIDQAQGFFKQLENTLVGETAILSAERKSQANIAFGEVSGNRDVQGQVQKVVEDTLEKVNLSGLDKDTRFKIQNRLTKDTLLGNDPIRSGIDALEEAKGRRKLFGAIPIGGEVSAEDKELINRQIEALKNLEDALRQVPRPQPQRQPPAARPRDAALPAATLP